MRVLPKLLAVIGLALPQQIGSVDLTRPAQPDSSREHRIPAGCESLKPGGIADGWPEPDDHKPRHIEVEVISVRDSRPALDSEVEAVVQLRNTDAHPIQIPWSIDPNVIEEGQKEDYMEWEGGTFEFLLTDEERIRLDSKVQPNGFTAPNSLRGVFL